VLDVNLVFAARFVHANRPAHDQLQSILGPAFTPDGLVAEADASHLRLLFLHREVQVAGLRGAIVGDFPLDPEIGKLCGESVANSSSQLRHAPDLSLWGEVQLELGYFLSHWTSQRITVSATLSRRQVTMGK